jgi:hypothetical protein
VRGSKYFNNTNPVYISLPANNIKTEGMEFDIIVNSRTAASTILGGERHGDGPTSD